MKIENLKLLYFQSHFNSSIDFHKWLNVIVGPSDSGKSSIIRALKLLITNRPSGNDYRTHDTEGTTVTLNDTISRLKTNSANMYLNGSDDFKCIRTDVPQQIRDELQLTEVNIQEQKDHFFLLNESSGSVSKKLNEVSGLANADASIQRVNRSVSFCKGQIKVKETEIEEKEKEVEALQWVFAADITLQQIEEKEKLVSIFEESHASISALINQYRETKHKIDSLVSDKFRSAVKAIILAYTVVEKLKLERSSLHSLLSKYNSVKEEGKNLQDIDISELKNSIERLSSYKKKRKDIKNLLDMMPYLETQINEIEINIKETDTQLKKFKRCSTCGQFLND